MNYQNHLKKGAKSGGVAGLSFGAAIYLIYILIVFFGFISGESIDIIQMVSFAVVLLAFLPVFGGLTGAPLALIYAKMEERLDRHDLSFALILSAVIVLIILRSGIQFAILFIPASVYVVYLERMTD